MGSARLRGIRLYRERLPFVNQLRKLHKFGYREARELWNGDISFQCVWTWLKETGIIKVVSYAKSRRNYVWCVA